MIRTRHETDILGAFIRCHAEHILLGVFAVAIEIPGRGTRHLHKAVKGPFALIDKLIRIVKAVLEHHILVEKDGVGAGNHVVGHAVIGVLAEPERVHHGAVPPVGGVIDVVQIIVVVEIAARHHFRHTGDAVQEYHLVYVVPGGDGFLRFRHHLGDVPGRILRDGDVEIVLHTRLPVEYRVVHGVPGRFVGEKVVLVPLPLRIGNVEIRSLKIERVRYTVMRQRLLLHDGFRRHVLQNRRFLLRVHRPLSARSVRQQQRDKQ